MRDRIKSKIKVLTNTLTQEKKVWTNQHSNSMVLEAIKARAMEVDIREVKISRYKSNLQTDRSQVFMTGLYGAND